MMKNPVAKLASFRQRMDIRAARIRKGGVEKSGMHPGRLQLILQQYDFLKEERIG
jgi:hypothetical protein